ncbi:lysylphosphatidylglycerol synthase transmembrane domain-containing protein [Paenibacillus sp. DMB5]|uniref:lysylphosphatidylglycerol synthase transmembrane domain-containing protein n=1 Tax=Paenibacillus sp. DMB5 TaxID=1780103 RepID=UPI00076C3B52|nr:lysylphosphatidylglycerol synthase transmembrane domain-containing protein [Paenibacillus sp. DMB5]KUP23931.1 hypothetical protein AWJ19_12355 [Paenibacillus sp. DMB5]
MGMLLFISAIVLLMVGHYFKMLRWKQFIEIYETPNEKLLLRSLSIGYLINFCMPFRLGDLIRVFISGRKMKNGISFSFSTVLVDRYLDVIVVSILFSTFTLSGLNDDLFRSSTIFYAVLACALIVISLIAVKYSRIVKKCLKKICSVFNSRIELNMLFFCWSIITSFKDIFRKVNKLKLLMYTVFIWGAYLASYFTLGLFLSNQTHFSSFLNIFATLFSRGSLDAGTVNLTYSFEYLTLKPQILFAVYLIIPLLALWALSYLPNKLKDAVFQNKLTSSSKVLNLLPQVNEEDRLNFLEAYFSGDGREYLAKYIELNQNISIIQDYSAGSNATVMLCMDENKSFYRKYAFGDDGDKLHQQLTWLRQYEKQIPLPQILNEQYGNGYCSYDMEYSTTAVGLFNYIHSRPLEKSRRIIRNTLDTLADNLYQNNQRPADPKLISQYITGKVRANLEKIKSSKEIKGLFDYETLIINGQEYKNLCALEEFLEEDYLTEIFKDDIYTEIHGDLTIENIICVEDSSFKPNFYLIDPNTGNVHDSPNLDYAKLMQSLHGGYEFLMKTQNVAVTKNEINFLFTRSQAYNSMFTFYFNYLNEKFSRKEIRSIFFHEIIHWLRLMPYKIEKNGKRAVLFYAGLIMVMNDVIDWFSDMSSENLEVAAALEKRQIFLA